MVLAWNRAASGQSGSKSQLFSVFFSDLTEGTNCSQVFKLWGYIELVVMLHVWWKREGWNKQRRNCLKSQKMSSGKYHHLLPLRNLIWVPFYVETIRPYPRLLPKAELELTRKILTGWGELEMVIGSRYEKMKRWWKLLMKYCRGWEWQNMFQMATVGDGKRRLVYEPAGSSGISPPCLSLQKTIHLAPPNLMWCGSFWPNSHVWLLALPSFHYLEECVCWVLSSFEVGRCCTNSWNKFSWT